MTPITTHIPAVPKRGENNPCTPGVYLFRVIGEAEWLLSIKRVSSVLYDDYEYIGPLTITHDEAMLELIPVNGWRETYARRDSNDRYRIGCSNHQGSVIEIATDDERTARLAFNAAANVINERAKQ